MSKKNKKRSKAKSSSSVAAAMRSANQRGSYGSAIATKALVQQLGAMTRALGKPGKKKRRKLTKAEKAARKRVLSAHRASAARAARLPGKKKRRPVKKAAVRTASKPAARRSSKRAPTVTAAQVINNATKAALKRWLCQGPRRSGCGAGGSRVVTGTGSFKRIRPMRFMTTG